MRPRQEEPAHFSVSGPEFLTFSRGQTGASRSGGRVYFLNLHGSRPASSPSATPMQGICLMAAQKSPKNKDVHLLKTDQEDH